MAYPYKQIEAFCPGCKHAQTFTLEPNTDTKFVCPECSSPMLENWTESLKKEGLLNQCPSCGCSNLYRQRDFNRRLGMAILFLGIVLSFFTYGISLVVVTLLDLFLYWKVEEVAVCYQCSAVYRGFEGIKRLDPFQLVLHDHYRISV